MYIYVNDMFIIGNNGIFVEDFKDEILKVFEMIALGLMSYFLDMNLKQDCDGVFKCQKIYVKEILKIFLERLQKHCYSMESKGEI